MNNAVVIEDFDDCNDGHNDHHRLEQHDSEVDDGFENNNIVIYPANDNIANDADNNRSQLIHEQQQQQQQQQRQNQNPFHNDNNNQESILFHVANRVLFCPAQERTARELRQLPPEQREQVWADMTGNPGISFYDTDKSRFENLNELHHQMQQLKIEIQKQLSKSNQHQQNEVSPYLLACQQDFSYVELVTIWILRAQEYDISSAATHILLHFHEKCKLFGPHTLGRNIMLTDLSKDDLEALAAGGYQFLTQQDISDRFAFISRYEAFKFKERNNMIRAVWYLFMRMVYLHDDITLLGVIAIGYEVGGKQSSSVDLEMIRQLSYLMSKVLPIRLVAAYICVNCGIWQRAAEVCSHLASPLVRLRLRTLQGSDQECRYKLMALGVPEQSLPLSPSGELDLSNHHEWIRAQHEMEQNELQEQQYQQPQTAMDVI